MRKFWIDTDTASDDAVAILMALRWEDVHVEGISIVAGNVPAEMGSRNARYTVELCGKNTPVYVGAAKPLCREPYWAFFFHGEDGMGGMHYPEPKRSAEPTFGVDALIEAVRRYPHEITLVTLGPLTNIALAILKAPDITEKIPQVVCMAGAAACLGNITPAAEYNVWVDPEAAKAVFHSGLPILMVGWEHCRGDANLNADEMTFVRSFNTPFAHFAIDCNADAIKANQRWLKDPALGLPDPVTMAIALEPSICIKRSKHYVTVETGSELTRGMTVVDERGVLNKEPNIEVCWQIDIFKWKETLYRTLK